MRTKRGAVSYVIAILVSLILVFIVSLLVTGVLNQTFLQEKKQINVHIEKLKNKLNNKLNNRNIVIISPYSKLNSKLKKYFDSLSLNYEFTTFEALKQKRLSNKDIILFFNSFNELSTADVYINEKTNNNPDYSQFYYILNKLGLVKSYFDNRIIIKNGLLYSDEPIKIKKNYNVYTDKGEIVDKGDHWEVSLNGAKFLFVWEKKDPYIRRDYYVFFDDAPEKYKKISAKLIILKYGTALNVETKVNSYGAIIYIITVPSSFEEQQFKDIYEYFHMKNILLNKKNKVIIYGTSSSTFKKGLQKVITNSFEFKKNKVKTHHIYTYYTYLDGKKASYDNYYLDTKEKNLNFYPFAEDVDYILEVILDETS